MTDFSSHPFPMTRWSLIARATREDDPFMREALDELLRRYLPALRTHLLISRRLAPDRAEDVLQSFITRRVVEQSLLTRVAPENGKFRTFLLKAMNNFLIDQLRAERAAKRSIEGHATQPITEHDGVSSPLGDDPARAFDIEWARQVIAQAADRMQADCKRKDRMDIWDVFESRVLSPALIGSAPANYEQIIARHGYCNPEQASNVLVTGRRAFQRALREVVCEYVQEGGQVEEELRELRAIVARPRGERARA